MIDGLMECSTSIIADRPDVVAHGLGQNALPPCTFAYSDRRGNTSGFPRVRQRDIPGLRTFRLFSQTRQGIITFRNQ
jgi:hypothetical protein